MSRACTVCLRSRMRDHVRHLHELEPGTSFRFEDEGAEHRLVTVTDASCTIADPPRIRRKRITPRFGEPVEFDQQENGVRRCAPCAQVVPCRS